MNYIGKGIYSIPEIKYLTGISSYKIDRWTNGYTYYRKKQICHIDPVYCNDYEDLDQKTFLSFLDLIEILFIDSFEKHGLSLQSIRKAADCAAKLFNTTHPFAKKVFYTDGKTILAKIAEENKDPDLLDLLKKQYQIESIVSPTLYECLDFNNLDLAEKWWPLGRSSRIVIDPKRNFGKPIIDDKNIRIETILDIYRSNKNIEEISNWYNIDELSIYAAIEFEKRLTA